MSEQERKNVLEALRIALAILTAARPLVLSLEVLTDAIKILEKQE